MIRNLWPLLIGFTLWAIAFLVLYSLQALGCVWGWSEGVHRSVLVGLAVIFILALAVLLFRQHLSSKRQASLQHAAPVLTGLALAAAVIIFAPVGFATLCH